MNKKHFAILSALLLCPVLAWGAVRYIKREVRGVWMATVYGIDWPSTTGYTASVHTKQKEEMNAMHGSIPTDGPLPRQAGTPLMT